MRLVTQTLGEQFALAVAAKDHEALLELLHPQLDFRAMTPNRFWVAGDADGVLGVLQEWFANEDHIEAVEAVEVAAYADRERVGYRFRVSNPEGAHLVEQQAYLSPRDGRIGWLRIMCAGYRPVD